MPIDEDETREGEADHFDADAAMAYSIWPKRLAMLAAPVVSMGFGIWLANFPAEPTEEELLPWMALHSLALSGLLLTWCYYDANARRFAISIPMTLVIILAAPFGFIWYVYKTRGMNCIINFIYLFLIAMACEFATQLGYAMAMGLTEGS